ncbi:MAG TPA: response regulator transcription factor [Candidatus Dormibacteraeota bacterium]|nr:response regulator transcription factor [Candidatus Dormibacteraeota bacterium]
MTDDVRVMLVDDHPLVRSGLTQLLDAAEGLTVVGAAAGGREAVDTVMDLVPDVVLMDVSMPGLDGVAATRELLKRRPATRVVMLTSYAEDDTVLASLDAGACGYILKDAEPAEVIRAVFAAWRGEAPLASRAARVLLGARNRPRSEEALTPREEEVLSLVGEGLANKQIAKRLGISEKTVKAHLTSVFQRIGVESRTEAALWAQQRIRRS